MAKVTIEYIEKLPPIYQDILDGFWMFNPNDRPEWGVAPETLFAVIHDKYSLGEVREACRQMSEGGALREDKDGFYHPTEIGREMIDIRQKQAGKTAVPQFSPPA